jgi:hypothetical protein
MAMRYKNGYALKVKIFTMDKSIFNTYHKDLTILDIDYPIANPVKVVTLGEYEEEFHPTIITEVLKSADEIWQALAEEYYDKENEDE